MRIRQHIPRLGQHLPQGAARGPHHLHPRRLGAQQRCLQRMVNGAVAGAGHHQALHAIAHQRIHHRAGSACMADDDFHAGPGDDICYSFNSFLRFTIKRWRPIFRQTNSTFLDKPQRSHVARREGIDAVRMHLLHMPRAMHLPGRHHHHAAGAGRRCHGHGVQQVLGAVGRQCRGRAHGTGQHHGLSGVQHLVQEPGGFLQRVGAVGDDDAAHIRVCEMVGAAQGQRTPHVPVHVLAVDLGHLLRQQRACHRLQPGHSRQQLGNTHLGGRVADVVARLRRRARDGAPGAQNHNFLPTHLRTPKNW